ncbi:MAG: outer membrane lipoprotein carrier protein LolA [Proteobacteria bacterium]|nr:outer membrane lipoprotein carrier protein LolA [Pseudomonadota bacterium]
MTEHWRPRLAAGIALALVGAVASRPAAAGAEDAAPSAAAACAERAVAIVQSHYDTVRDLTAAFEQRTQSLSLGGGPAANTVRQGRVVFAKPGKMRWTYEQPDRSLVVSDGEILWMVDLAAREAQRLPVTGGQLSGAALQFLLGEGKLAESFRVEAQSCDAGRARLVLWPREDAPYERLGLVASTATGAILESSVIDLFGNATRIVFRDVQINREPPPGTFTFEPPTGFDVIDLTPAAP